MNAVSRKLHKLERNVLEQPKLGTTKLCTCSMPLAEREVLYQARRIAERTQPFEKVSPEQRELLDKAGELLHYRVFDIFSTYMTTLLCGDSGVAKVLFYQRFFQFVEDVTREIMQLKKKAKMRGRIILE